jgi:hypothetical protein
MYEDDVKKTSITGTVVKSKFGGTSKSAHTGFALQNKEGAIKLRRDGASPFYDEFFEKYESKNVIAEGFDMEQYFLVTAVRMTKTESKKKG